MKKAPCLCDGNDVVIVAVMVMDRIRYDCIRRANVLYSRNMMEGDEPYDLLYIVCRRMMRCLVLVAVRLMCVLNFVLL